MSRTVEPWLKNWKWKRASKLPGFLNKLLKKKKNKKSFCGENEPAVWSWIKPSWLSTEVCDLLDHSVVLLCYVFVKVGDLQLAYTMVFVCDLPLSAVRVNETNKSKQPMAGLCIRVRRGLASWLGTVLIDSSAVAVLTLILSAEMTDVGRNNRSTFFFFLPFS